jgi:glycosyltransferase involved in cell wall biosynthesis
MLDDTKISVIVPCYNVEKYIRECLDSILGQSIGMEHLELILVDDRSTDGTVAILKEYEQTYSDNIILVLCEENGRQGTARNIGLQYASGDYVLFVDSDDWIHRDLLKIVCRVAKEYACDIVQFRDSGARGKMYAGEPFTVQLYEYKKNRKEYLLHSEILNESCRTKLYRKDLLDRAQVRFAEKLCYEEPLFTYPLKFYADRVGVVELPLYFYRLNEKGTTVETMKDPSSIIEHLEVQQRVYDQVRQLPCYPEYKDEIDLYYMHSFFVEPFYFLGARGISMPIDLCRSMGQQLRRELPDFWSNPYLSDESLKEEKDILESICIVGREK